MNSFSFPATSQAPQSTFMFNPNPLTLTQPVQPLQQTAVTSSLPTFGQTMSSFAFPTTSQAPQSTFMFHPNPLALTQPVQPLQQTVVTATAESSRGLGGEGAAGGQTNTNMKSAKDQHLPPELNTLVESFKTFIKDQKIIRDENVQPRFSFQPIVEINTELDEVLRVQLESLQVILQKNKKTVDSLKQETSSLVSDAETAHRALKSEGISSMSYPLGPDKYVTASTTLEYFNKLVDTFEERMKTYSRQIRELEVHLDYLHKPTQTQDLLIVVKKQHEALVALAAEIYRLHETVSKIAGDHTEEQLIPTGKTINIGGDPSLPEERPISKPIAFPTFSIQKKTQMTPTSSTGENRILGEPKFITDSSLHK